MSGTVYGAGETAEYKTGKTPVSMELYLVTVFGKLTVSLVSTLFAAL